MQGKKHIFVIIGSASKNSANEKLVNFISSSSNAFFIFTVLKDLKTFPHFDPELSTEHPPNEIIELRKTIEQSDGIIICTPEYVFSIPSGLKNILEWCVATTIFSNKPTGLITASASGEKGHEELKLIMKTLAAKFTEHTTLLIQSIKAKVNAEGEINDAKTMDALSKFITAFKNIVNENTSN